MLFAPVSGSRVRFETRSLGTSSVDLVPAQQTVMTLDSLSASNTTGSIANFTLEIWDGTNATAIVPGSSVAAKTAYVLNDHHVPLKVGEILRVRSGTDASFDVVAVLVQGTNK